ncbi:hypothetical protein L4X63_02315 [Geomonas sp. Red32]|uniref:hypothetical protein n=1 Tax=Geomonas sp. Red32 TaxID=2912856 RepID=UPI00202CD455|nr:hypothetical protein [Geomonas sp. Red32]MCM0080414.1 hypothetical protein [Geomonas sp. Red32]
MRKVSVGMLLVLGAACFASGAQADEVVCKGSITSIQGEGLVARSHRFDVDRVVGQDVNQILENCRQIARDKQNRASRRNPGGNFRKNSQVALQCQRGAEKFEVKRTIDTP